MKLADEKLEALRQETTKKIKLACGIPLEEKVLRCLSAKTDGKYMILEYTRTDFKTFSKGDAGRLSINGNYATSKGDKIEVKVKLAGK